MCVCVSVCIVHITHKYFAPKNNNRSHVKTKDAQQSFLGKIPLTLLCVKKEKETVCLKFLIFKFELIHISHECAVGVTVRNSESQIDCMNLLTFTFVQNTLWERHQSIPSSPQPDGLTGIACLVVL